MDSIGEISVIDSEQAAVQYLKNAFIRPSSFLDRRYACTVGSALRMQIAECSETITTFVRGAIIVCLSEMRDRDSSWHDKTEDSTHAADFFAFIQNERVVNASNRGAILDILNSVLRDVDTPRTQKDIEINERCERTIFGLLANDEASRVFTDRTKEKYSIEYWKRKDFGDSVFGIEMFHGVVAAFQFAIEQTATRDSLWDIAINTNASSFKEDWRALLIEKSGTTNENELLFLKAIEIGSADEVDATALSSLIE